MRKIFLGFVSCVLAIIAAVLGGCGSTPPSKFYHLDSMDSRNEVEQHTVQGGRTIITLGPVRIPDYLDRPQIITSYGENEFNLSEFDRWAGSLENDIVRVLAEDISAQLSPERYLIVRWSPLLETQVTASYRVQMIINRFEGSLDGKVRLRTQWGIFGANKDLVLKESSIDEPVAGKDYQVLVHAMSTALEKLSKEIAAEITSLSEQTTMK